MKLKIFTEESKEALEAKVSEYCSGSAIISANFQRNLFYPRKDSGFCDDLRETWTAFILTKDP